MDPSSPPDRPTKPVLSRRRLLKGGVATAGALAATAGGAALVTETAGAAPVKGPLLLDPFYGAHQAGIVHSPVAAPASAAVVSFDLTCETRAELVELMHTLTDTAKGLVAGGPESTPFEAAVPADDGILGPDIPTRAVTVTVGVGATVFDDRFGLADRRPAHLILMRTFPNDNLDPAQCHGDLSVLLQAVDPDTVVHAVRQLMVATRGAMQPKWRIHGYTSPPRPSGVPRNHFGFNDGIANPDVNSPSQMDSLVWVGPGLGEPTWAYGGSYQVVRIIRQLVEFWDRVSLLEQEDMIGRQKASGAPLDANNYRDIPNYAADPQGLMIPLTAHIRLANPRTAKTEPSRILRRSFNYDRGLDSNGNLDMGLLFTCYQQDVTRQFEAVQTRLINEPMVDYISPIGGGYFFVLPGVRDAGDWYGRSLLSD